MGKIYVIGLGPGSIDSLTLGALERINSGDKNFLRTEKHPTVQYFRERIFLINHMIIYMKVKRTLIRYIPK